MSKYMVIGSFTTTTNDYDVYTSLDVVGMTDKFEEVKTLAEEDLDRIAHEYADCFDLDEDDADDMAEYEEHIDDYVRNMENRGTLVENTLALNIPELFMSNDFDDGNSLERSEYYVIKLEG